MTEITWDYLLEPIGNVMLDYLYEHISDTASKEALSVFPTALPPFCFPREQIIQVYDLLEVDWNEGGWLHERPSNVWRARGGGAVRVRPSKRNIGKRYIGESTNYQIRNMLRQMSSDQWCLSERDYLLTLTWKTLSYEQKLLYVYLIKKWGLVK